MPDPESPPAGPSAWGGGGAAPRKALGYRPEPGAVGAGMLGAADPGRGPPRVELRGRILVTIRGPPEGGRGDERWPYSSVSVDDVMDDFIRVIIGGGMAPGEAGGGIGEDGAEAI